MPVEGYAGRALDIVRRSFRTRLLLGAIVWITLGLGAGWTSLYLVIHGHIVTEFEEELRHHGTELAGLTEVGPDGKSGFRQPLSDHRFFETGSGFYWQIEWADGQITRSKSLGSAGLPLALTRLGGASEQVTMLNGPTGALMLLESAIVPKGAQSVAGLSMGIDLRLIDELLEQFNWTLGLSLMAVASGLIAAVFAQVTYGLRPLTRIKQALVAIRRGETDQMPDDLPLEVAPLAESLNDMIRANDEIVRQARSQAGNLAHALKTPLAILVAEAHRLEAAGVDSSTMLRECERMRRQIEYQLANARAAASRKRPRVAAAVGPAVRNIIAAISQLSQDRGLSFRFDDQSRPLWVACEPDDLDEMLGNLIDNAAKWARTCVMVSIRLTGARTVQMDVEDDGPGMPPEAREVVFEAGERLDEQVPGTGLGLAIVRDVARLYGGRAWIDQSSLGGAAVHLDLPAVEDATEPGRRRDPTAG